MCIHVSPKFMWIWGKQTEQPPLSSARAKLSEVKVLTGQWKGLQDYKDGGPWLPISREVRKPSQRRASLRMVWKNEQGLARKGKGAGCQAEGGAVHLWLLDPQPLAPGHAGKGRHGLVPAHSFPAGKEPKNQKWGRGEKNNVVITNTMDIPEFVRVEFSMWV